MTRGNQRDLAREKAQKKVSDSSKNHRDDDLSHAARKESDAEIMRKKQEVSKAKKAE